MELAAYASILTITAFSVERWLAICFPLKVHLLGKRSRALKVIAAVWAIAAASAAPFAVFATVNRLPLPPDYRTNQLSHDLSPDGIHVARTEFCYLEHENESAKWALINWSFWAFFCLPLTTIALLYAHMGLKIHAAAKVSLAQSPSASRSNAVGARRGVVRMLAAVVAAFFVCWSPYHAQRLMTIYMDWDHHSAFTHTLFNTLYYISGSVQLSTHSRTQKRGARLFQVISTIRIRL